MLFVELTLSGKHTDCTEECKYCKPMHKHLEERNAAVLLHMLTASFYITAQQFSTLWYRRRLRVRLPSPGSAQASLCSFPVSAYLSLVVALSLKLETSSEVYFHFQILLQHASLLQPKYQLNISKPKKI